MKRTLLSLIFILISTTAVAKVEVAFFPGQNKKERKNQFEEGGMFLHSAISFRGQWLNANPYNGVILSPNLKSIGKRPTVLSHELYTEPDNNYVMQRIGRPFDIFSPWDSCDSFNCSQVVAQWFGIPPQPMDFDTEFWAEFENLPVGEPGLSPDEIFLALKELGFKKVSNCDIRLRN